MADLNLLTAMLARITSFSPSGAQSLGGIARDLEILFEKLNRRSPSLERAYYDFWNAAEVIWVSCTEEKRPTTEKEINDVKILLSKVEDVVKTEIQALEC